MSGFFDDGPAQPPRRPAAAPASPQRSRALIGTAVILVAAFFLVSIFTGVWTDRLWFRSVGYADVFTKVLGTRVLLFLVFGLLLGVVVAVNVVVAYKVRPVFRPASAEQVNLDRYREVVEPVRRWVLIGVAMVLALFAGSSGAGQWRQFLLWRNREQFGIDDPYFNKDVGFYVFELPWLHYLVDFAMAAVVLSIIAAVVVHYLFGGIRLQSRHDKLTGAAQVHLSVLLGLFVLAKAADYWLDRFDLTTEAGRLFTGMGYTDQNAVLPSKNILMFIALICALLFFANVFRRTWMLPTVGLAMLVVSAILLGAIWPGIVQQFQVRPSEPDRERPYIARNIEATRTAYDVADSQVTPYDAQLSISEEELGDQSVSIPNTRLLDPNLVSDAFEQLQQVRGYYSVADVLDVDRYQVNDETRDMVIAVRELDQSGLDEEQRNWANLHTVYTHGYGVIAAYGNQRDAENQPVTDTEGRPVWSEQDIPPKGQLTDLFEDGYQPRIYFGEKSPSYSIVGKPDDGRDVELDIPEGTGGDQPTNNTYDGEAGIPVGGFFNKLLYAIKFSEPNIVLSNRVNENSQILYDRTPRERVQKVAPWLTVDGDVYPAVVDGRVKWIVDGYTTTDQYPNAQKDSLSDMTSDSLQPRTAYATLPTDEINYMRNSVKAVVDAYDGTVDLYEWDRDPILNAWSKAFPNVVQPRAEIPEDLLEHMRYPEDLFKVQRKVLAEYHVTDPKIFYAGSDAWKVPEDPEIKTNSQPPYRLSIRVPGNDQPVFSLTSVYVPQKRQNLASFISVDADASEDEYGQIRILRLPSNTQVPGPSQIANEFASDQEIQDKLLAFTRTNSKAQFGNLLTLPAGDGLLYVQPLYTLRQSGEGRYPVLRYVLVSFGDEVGIGSTLTDALRDVLGLPPAEEQPVDVPTGEQPPTSGGEVPRGVEALLQQAEDKFAEAEEALQSGDLAAYQDATEEAEQLVLRALAAAARERAQQEGGSQDGGTQQDGGSGGQ